MRGGVREGMGEGAGPGGRRGASDARGTLLVTHPRVGAGGLLGRFDFPPSVAATPSEAERVDGGEVCGELTELSV